MRLGDEVPGILTDKWMFVADDTHKITERVKQYDSACRLVCHVETKQLGIARWVQAEFAQGGAWMIAFRARDPETGDPIIGEPDERVVWQMGRFDTWRRRNPERMDRAVAETIRRRQEQLSEAEQEKNAEMAEKFVRGWKQRTGIKDKIIVPTGAGGSK